MQSCHMLHFDKPLSRWDEALPLGNGLTGCLIWGNSEEMRFSLDRGDLWDTTPSPLQNSPLFNYDTLKKMSHGFFCKEANDIFDNTYYYPTPTKLPAGKLIFHFPPAPEIISELDIHTAQASVRLKGSASIKTFLHARRNAGFIEVSLPKNQFQVRLENPQFGQEGIENEDRTGVGISAGSLKTLHYPLPRLGKKDNIEYYTQKINDDLTYGIVLGSREEEGKTLLVYTIAASTDGENFLEKAIENVQKNLLEGYEAAFSSHLSWWQHYWQESSISLPDQVLEKGWYLSSYLLGACSRKNAPPMPLQGVWTADDGRLPPWKGDYHNDLNTQLCYYSYLKANHLEQGESFLDFLWNLMPAARKFARDFYHGKGQCLPGVMDIEGKPLGGWPMYSFSPAMQIWLCQTFERHFRLTGDMDFLRERAYPYMKETAEFELSLMEKDENGFLTLPTSSSPEIHDNTQSAWLHPMSNFDVSLLRYLFTQLIRLSSLLHNKEEETWKKVLEQLPPLSVSEDHILMINPREMLPESHRHMSHAMAIHPLRLLNPDCPAERDIIEKTVWQLVKYGSCNWTGYSLAWMAEMWCILGNGEGAAWQLRNFYQSFCLPNGFHINGDYKKRGLSLLTYRPFTLEGNMCAMDAMQEMLLRSENGLIQVFPAIPEDFLKGNCSFTTLRGEMGMLVSARMKDGRVEEVVLTAEQDGRWTFKSPWENPVSDLSGVLSPLPGQENCYAVVLKKGQTLHLSGK